MNDLQAHKEILELYDRNVAGLPRSLVSERSRSGGRNVFAEESIEKVYGTRFYYGTACPSMGWKEETVLPAFPSLRVPAPYALLVATRDFGSYRIYKRLRDAGYFLASPDDDAIVEYWMNSLWRRDIEKMLTAK